jgi:UDP-glucose 4-epimerase
VKITVTGGLGFIGSFVAERLVALGHDVTIVDNRAANVVDDVDGATVYEMDCRDASFKYADAVVHCASPVGAVALLRTGYSVTHEIVDTTHHVASRCASRGIPMLNISTSEVYGFSGEYRESDDLRVPDKHSARLEYAVGKMAGEHAVHGFRNLAFTNIRPFNVTGPRQTSAKGFVLPTFVEQAIENKPLTVFGDGQQERSFTSVYDLADFIAWIVHNGQFFRNTLNVGNPKNRTTIAALAGEVLLQTGSASEVVYTDGKTVHGADYEEAEGFVKVPNIDRAASLGFSPRHSLPDLIDLTIKEAMVAA